MGYADRKTIVIEIDKQTGNIHSETFGYVGDSCITDLEALMADLAELTSDNSKPERWQTELAQNNTAEIKREI